MAAINDGKTMADTTSIIIKLLINDSGNCSSLIISSLFSTGEGSAFESALWNGPAMTKRITKTPQINVNPSIK